VAYISTFVSLFSRTVAVVTLSSGLVCPAGGASPSGSKAGVQPLDESEVSARADAIIARMSAEEKAGQLSQYFYFHQLPPLAKLVDESLDQGRVGSLLFVTDPAETNRLQKIAVDKTRLKIPLLFGFDVIHGFRTIFPVPLGMAASWDPKMVEDAQAIAATEARAVGIHWAFAPNVDIARDPRWGRIVEGAGEDPL
jgi:beta-glucosidase